MDDGFPKDAQGFPRLKLEYVASDGTNEAYVVPSPISKNLASNVYASNFYNPADHGGTIPVSMRVPGAGLRGTSPFYEIQCLDREMEFIARIRVQVREWNSLTEFALGAGVGNPDAGGNEAGFGNPLINDFFDWKDFGAGYPGFSE